MAFHKQVFSDTGRLQSSLSKLWFGWCFEDQITIFNINNNQGVSSTGHDCRHGVCVAIEKVIGSISGPLGHHLHASGGQSPVEVLCCLQCPELLLSQSKNCCSSREKGATLASFFFLVHYQFIIVVKVHYHFTWFSRGDWSTPTENPATVNCFGPI